MCHILEESLECEFSYLSVLGVLLGMMEVRRTAEQQHEIVEKLEAMGC